MQLGPSGLTELERLHMEPNSERSVSQSPYSNHTVFACMSQTHVVRGMMWIHLHSRVLHGVKVNDWLY